jgi:tetratricopeptide (TPR) repeat protein
VRNQKRIKFSLCLSLALALSLAPLSTSLTGAALAQEKQSDSGRASDAPDKDSAKQDDTTASQSDESTQSQSDAKQDGDTASVSQDGESEASSQDNKAAKQSTEDPAEQSLIGGEVSAKGNQGLDHYDLAHFYFTHWQLPLAEVEYEVSIMYAPGMKVAHRDYCLVSLLRGHPLRALAEMMMVVGLGDPIPLNDQEKLALIQRASKVHYRKALVYARNSKWDDAISELQWALAYTPNKPAVVHSLAFCYASKGDFSQAEQEYSKGFALDPDDAFSHADFSDLLAAHGQTDKAQGQMRRALMVAPQVAALHVDMSWLAETKGDFATAQNELREAIKLCPNQPGLWLHLGKVLERSGRSADAIAAYKQALALDSSEDEAKQRLSALSTNAPLTPEKQHS